MVNIMPVCKFWRKNDYLHVEKKVLFIQDNVEVHTFIAAVAKFLWIDLRIFPWFATF